MKECISCKIQETVQWYTGPRCKPCYRREHRIANIEKYKQKDSKFYEANQEKIKARQNKYYEEHQEECKERSKSHRDLVGDQRREGYFEDYYSKPENKIKREVATLRWRRANPEKQLQVWRDWSKRNLPYRAYQRALYRAKKVKATPKWLTSEHLDQIRAIYETCPKGYDVDHQIPLKSKLVCGLHVPWNLKAIPSTENRQKNNKLTSTIIHHFD
jgi:hypothetical protein